MKLQLHQGVRAAQAAIDSAPAPPVPLSRPKAANAKAKPSPKTMFGGKAAPLFKKKG